ncbi:ribonuclease HII [Palleronia sediminis]|uniref:Ribonuclease HII n=1 Tax=Palleronia sediminis TaxID=2547833 RepID=A0A4R6AC76_9RHOB|nr:ribonuclease HII [Palleronia sediminis]TDL81581.1 ribonuclease HII [Palleronia sediminis]
MPDFTHELAARRGGSRIVAGVDEVGRGPLAGPVVAAAVVLDAGGWPEGLDDSKAMTAARRDRIAADLRDCARIGIGAATVEEIDRLNILQATFLAMRRAIEALPVRPDHLLIDGNRLPPNLPCAAQAIVKGDALSLSISAASIMAKTWRDLGMVGLAQQHPFYGWERNMGYGTREHLDGLKSHGVTQHHRRSFRPVHQMLFQENYAPPGDK